MENKVKVIIPASGSGIRFGGKLPKQFLKIQGIEILALTIKKFHVLKSVDEIVIAAKTDFFNRISRIIKKYDFYKVKKIVEGGNMRQISVLNALKSLDCAKKDIVLVHDAVRPFITVNKIKEIITAAVKEKCVVPCLSLTDTVKIVNPENYIVKTIDRDNLRIVQTPQAFIYEILLNSFENAVKKNFIGTDEASVVEFAGYKIKIIDGEIKNIKVTSKEDLKNIS